MIENLRVMFLDKSVPIFVPPKLEVPLRMQVQATLSRRLPRRLHLQSTELDLMDDARQVRNFSTWLLAKSRECLWREARVDIESGRAADWKEHKRAYELQKVTVISKCNLFCRADPLPHAPTL